MVLVIAPTERIAEAIGTIAQGMLGCGRDGWRWVRDYADVFGWARGTVVLVFPCGGASTDYYALIDRCHAHGYRLQIWFAERTDDQKERV